MTPYTLLMNAIDPVVLDRHSVPPRPERLAPAPRSYSEGAIGAWLNAMTCGRDPWSHQSKALSLDDEGHNVVIATGTASGKTLPLQATVIRELLGKPDTTFLIFCPQIALTGDQTHRWRAAVALAGLDPDLVGEINGRVPPCERDDIIKRARVLIVTPDIVHRSLLRQLSVPSVRGFIGNLSKIGIDEAHELQGVFGSNCAYFFRRLRAAHRKLMMSAGKAPKDFGVMAASATIADPKGHLEALTGLPFEVVSESDNGAPFHGLELIHIEGPGHGAAAETLLVEYVSRIASQIAPNAAIAFVNNRQGVERITARIGMANVEPYRAGLEAVDRAAIEKALRDGNLAAVVGTSALELGIDIPQFVVGLNLGVPDTLMSLKQRSGRAGRVSESVFAVIAPASGFAKLGTSLGEFFDGEIEASPLYLDNAIIQYQQACCLLDESTLEDGTAQLPHGIDWPKGFAAAFAMAFPGAPKPREIEQIAWQSSGVPQADNPLRKLSDTQYALRIRGSGDKIGTIDGDKALQEAYPAAIYYQRKKAYRVTGWVENGYERSIYVEPTPHSPRTHPIMFTQISASHRDSELQEGRLLASDLGSLAEIRIRVTEKVIGYSYRGKQNLYSDLSKKDPRKVSKQRNYTTTGVLIRLNEPWFNGQGGAAGDARKQVAQALKALLTSKRSIASSEIGYAHSGIAMHGAVGPQRIHDAVVLYDNMPGGVRLTEPLFSELEHFLERLRRGAELAGTEALLDEISVGRLGRWYRSLRPPQKVPQLIPDMPAGERLIYATGSIVGVRIGGAVVERRLLGHHLLAMDGAEHLAYLYESGSGVKAMVPHDQIEPVGHDWRHVVWDPTLDTVREIAA